MAKKKKKAKSFKNIVAKFASEFNRSEVFRDKTKYRRKEKYRKNNADTD
jgi:hypothetical protein